MFNTRLKSARCTSEKGLRSENTKGRVRAGRHGPVKTAVIALLLLLSAPAYASQGYISLYYNVEGVGESSFTLSHSEGASEGLDGADMIWYFIACPECRTDTRAVSYTDGQLLKSDVRPLNSESGASVSCSMVSKNEDPIDVNNAGQWVDIFMFGFDGYDIYVDGYNAREVGSIDLGPVTGTFSSGETLVTLRIEFSRRSGEDPDPPPPGTDPVTPDPPGGDQPGPDASPQNTLYITNSIEGYPQDRIGVWTLTHVQGALDAIDANDVPYAGLPGADGGQEAYCVSTIVSTTADPVSAARCLLAGDARPPDTREDIDIGVGIVSPAGEPIYFASPTANHLIFSFPAGASNCFDDKPMTFQQYDPVNRDLTYPIWDIRKIVDKNEGILPLEDLLEYRSSGVPYLCARVSTSRPPGDIMRNGRIDANDFDRVASQEGLTGVTEADVAGPAGLGLPDGLVDVWDLYYLYKMLDDAERSKVVAPPSPLPAEGFETGDLSGMNWYCMQWPHWFVTSDDCHAGTYSARAGRVEDGGCSSLQITADCMDGEISFWRRVSSEGNWDFYRFYLDGNLKEELSGSIVWSEISFPVTAGRHTFKWEYEKDDSSSLGEDTVYIDDVCFPVAKDDQ